MAGCTSFLHLDSISHIWDFLSHVNAYEDKVNSLSKELAVVKALSDEVKEKVDAVERHGFKPPDEVLSWLNSIHNFVAEATSIVSQFNGRMTCLGNIPINLCSTYQLSKRIEKLLAAVEELKKKANFSNLLEELVPGGLLGLLNSRMPSKGEVIERLHDQLEVVPSKEEVIERLHDQLEVVPSKEEMLGKLQDELGIDHIPTSLEKIDVKEEVVEKLHHELEGTSISKVFDRKEEVVENLHHELEIKPISTVIEKKEEALEKLHLHHQFEINPISKVIEKKEEALEKLHELGDSASLKKLGFKSVKSYF